MADWKPSLLNNWVKITTHGNEVNFKPSDLCTKRPVGK